MGAHRAPHVGAMGGAGGGRGCVCPRAADPVRLLHLPRTRPCQYLVRYSDSRVRKIRVATALPRRFQRIFCVRASPNTEKDLETDGSCSTNVTPCSCADDCESDDCEYLFGYLDSRCRVFCVGNALSGRFHRKKTDIVNPNSEKDIRLAVLQPLQVQSGSGRIF